MVKVINIGPGQTLKFQNSCDIMKQYCEFIDIIRKNTIPNDIESYRQAVQKAINLGILKKYLTRNSTEVVNMLIAEYDYETDISVKCAEAREEGINSKSVEDALVLIKDFNISPEIACQKIGAPLEVVKERLKENH